MSIKSQSRPVDTFDPDAELARIRAKRAEKRKSSFHPSKLDRFTRELIAFKERGAKPAEIIEWLSERRVKCAPSTLFRWFAKHEEVCK